MPRPAPAACAAALLAALALRAEPAAAQAGMAHGPAQMAGSEAAAAPAVAITGEVRAPRTLDLAALQALPAITVEVRAAPNQGGRTTAFTGALLWPVLQAAGPVDAPGRATQHQHTLLAQGRDGYAVALAFGEMDPHLEGKQVLLAYAQDGKPLPAPRLVVPGDSHAGRGVRDLVSVTVR